MTVSTINSVAEFVTNGITKNFPFYFKFLDSRDLVVTYIDPDGISTVLTMGTQYTVSGTGNDKGGSIATTTSLSGPGQLIVSRDMEAYQQTSLRNQGKFLAETHEDVFDRLTMLIQQGLAIFKRALIRPFGRDYFYAEGRRITDLANPKNAQDAATKGYADGVAAGAISYTDAQMLRTVRSVDGETLTQLPVVASRANKVMGFDVNGQPIGVLPASGSGTELAIDLANGVDPNKGTGLLSIDSRTLRDYIKQQEYYLTIEYFGETDTPANTKETMQVAINFCALNGILLRNKVSAYTVDVSESSITIPNDFRCEIYAKISRQTGNKTPHDMWVNADMVNGNTGLDIRGVHFDGQRQADNLNKDNPAHRFCGLRLVKCSGQLYNCRVNNTVNAEVQGEGNRGGIMLDRSVDMKVSTLFADGTDGSGVFCYQGKNYVEGVWTKNNTGSGFTSFGCDNNDFHHIHSDGSGYSGVSVNGMNMRCSFLNSKNSPVGFAGVNIGHDDAGNRATGSQVDTVTVESALGWGIVLAGSSNVSATNWKAVGSTLNNLRVINSPGLNITYRGENSLGSDTYIAGFGEHFGQFVISGAAFNGLATGTVAGTKVSMGELSYITGCGSIEVNTAGVNVADNSEVVVRGKIVNNRQRGVIAAGDADAVAVLTSAAKISGNEAGNVLSLTGGVLRYEGAKFSDDVMSGNVTIAAGSALTTVLNGNAVDSNRITLVPGNAAARAAGQALVSSIEAGTSFGVQISANAAAAVIYRWAIF